jgi:flagellar hook-associated protein 2
VGSSSIGFNGVPTLNPALSTSPSDPSTTGLSGYAAALQNALNRSVGLAALPLQELQSEQSLLNNQSSALSSLDTQFSVLQSTISRLSSASLNLLSSSVSEASVISASIGAGAQPGTYKIHVAQAGSFSTAISADGLATVSDPSTQNVSAAASFTLVINGVSQPPITLAQNNLNSLAAAINGNASLGVQATVVNVGPPTAPDYRLSLQSTHFGADTIQLKGDGTDLMTGLTTGSLVQYQVNGVPATPISSDTGTVTVAPGLTVSLLQAGDSTVTVSQSATAISTALTSFVTAFNASVDELNKSFGQNSGPLNGQSIIFDLRQALHGLSNYSGGGGSFTSLTDLGLSFDTDGHLTFDSSKLSGVSGAKMSDLISFLGSPTSGGFLQYATNRLTAVEDPTTGSLKSAINSTANQITHENQLIAKEQARISRLQDNLQARMAAADAAISQIESQLSYYTGLFQAMYAPRTSQF